MATTKGEKNTGTVIHAGLSKTEGEGGAYVWHSEDWVESPRTQAPYNGLEITALPAYDPQTKRLTGIAVTLFDYTLSQTGEPMPYEFPIDYITSQAEIPVNPIFGEGEQLTTATGQMKFMGLNSAPGQTYLLIDLKYGADVYNMHEVDGLILRIPLEQPSYT